MSGWDITANFINLVSRFPFERLLDRGPGNKALDALEKRLLDRGLLKPSSKPLAFKLPPASSSIVVKEPLPPPPLPTIDKEDEVNGGTRGAICFDEHVTRAATDLTEAPRMIK